MARKRLLYRRRIGNRSRYIGVLKLYVRSNLLFALRIHRLRRQRSVSIVAHLHGYGKGSFIITQPPVGCPTLVFCYGIGVNTNIQQ